MAIARYQKGISGPLLDRIDIHVEVPRVDYETLADKRNVGEFASGLCQGAVGARTAAGILCLDEVDLCSKLDSFVSAT